jgi:hypothetical protein
MEMEKIVSKNYQHLPKYWEFCPKILNQIGVQKFLRMKVYNALNFPILLYGSEIWTFRKMDKKRLATV